MQINKDRFNILKNSLKGDLFIDKTHRTIYSTDASVYKEEPIAVAFPKNEEDIKELIKFAEDNKTSLIPRGAGTSLAGQVTGEGIVVDVSKYMNEIIKIDTENKIAVVQPGVVLSELNKALLPYKLQFGPETSSANRCTIGGMSGNNACGLHSLVHGSTREHTVSIRAVLSNAEIVVFKELSKEEFEKKCIGEKLENKIYSQIKTVLSNGVTLKNIDEQYPDKRITRRNTGYALDILSDSEIFRNSDKKFNFCNLLSGSEGTLAFATEITLNLIPILPKVNALVVAHFEELEHSFYANLIALKYKPTAIELSDKTILDLTKDNITQNKNRFFIKDDPKAILIIEFAEDSKEEILSKAKEMEAEMRNEGYGFHFPVIFGEDIKKVWELRKAGLGVLSNMKGDAKPVSVTEDTAINVEKLPEFIKEFDYLLKSYKLECVYHAHIATGELHLRPILNLKDPNDVRIFKTIAYKTVVLVKKYKGSLSGEHGDGRLRGEFVKLMYGKEIYSVFKQIKKTWDENNIFNPYKIIDSPPMNTSLRYNPGERTKQFPTYLNFSKDGGILRAVEKCNGSGDCRKSEIIGGTMCPSFMATRDESASTRARANMLRETLSKSVFPFTDDELYKILDLCLSCKACKSECPSGIDMAKLKAEFLQQYYDRKRIPLRTLLIANITRINKYTSHISSITNWFMSNEIVSGLIFNIIGFTRERKYPLLQKQTLNKYFEKQIPISSAINDTVYLFSDEFTNYYDTPIGIKAIKLLEFLGYKVLIPGITESGRTFFSKGLLKKGKLVAQKNLDILESIINSETPFIGIEPSAILSFRDEYLDLFDENSETEKKYYQKALKIAANSFTIEEFLKSEIEKGKISKDSFTSEEKEILYHGHCQQKAVSGTDAVKFVLSFPENYTVKEIASGCCGMAGSFGFEVEHYGLSNKIGELVLFPEVRKAKDNAVISASGTSCRHQIKDGTGVVSKHPVEILYDAALSDSQVYNVTQIT